MALNRRGCATVSTLRRSTSRSRTKSNVKVGFHGSFTPVESGVGHPQFNRAILSSRAKRRPEGRHLVAPSCTSKTGSPAWLKRGRWAETKPAVTLISLCGSPASVSKPNDTSSTSGRKSTMRSANTTQGADTPPFSRRREGKIQRIASPLVAADRWQSHSNRVFLPVGVERTKEHVGPVHKRLLARRCRGGNRYREWPDGGQKLNQPLGGNGDC